MSCLDLEENHRILIHFCFGPGFCFLLNRKLRYDFAFGSIFEKISFNYLILRVEFYLVFLASFHFLFGSFIKELTFL